MALPIAVVLMKSVLGEIVCNECYIGRRGQEYLGFFDSAWPGV